MRHWFDTVSDENNRHVSGAIIKVYTSDATVSGTLDAGNLSIDGSLELIYSDDGTTAIDQDGGTFLTTNSLGWAEFWANSATVVLAVYFDGELKRVVTDVELDGSGGSGGSVVAGPIGVSGLTMSSGYVLGRDTSGTGAIEELTISAALDLIGSAVQGDIIYRNDSGWTRLAAGTDGYFLKTQGGGANPEWAEVPVTEEDVRDVIGTALTEGTGIDITVNDGADTITIAVDMSEISASDIKPLESWVIACSDETTALTTGMAKRTFRAPYPFTVTAVRASLGTAQASGSIFTVDINETGTSILSTKLTIDNTEKTSTTAATAAVISDSSIADDAEITIDIDQIGTSGAAGLKVVLIGHRT